MSLRKIRVSEEAQRVLLLLRKSSMSQYDLRATPQAMNFLLNNGWATWNSETKTYSLSMRGSQLLMALNLTK